MAIKITAEVDAAVPAPLEGHHCCPASENIHVVESVGEISDTREAAMRAADCIPALSRAHRRQPFEPHYSVAAMDEDSPPVSQPPIDSPLTPIYAV
jgi:hypothetical protein